MRRRRSERGERGAVLVETVFILPVLVLLISGIVEFGMTFREASTITASTRAGARIASAMPRNPAFVQATADAVSSAINDLPSDEPQQLWIYAANQYGFPGSSTSMPTTCSTKCVIYTWSQAAKAFQSPSGSYPATGPSGQNACPGSTDQVGVYVKGLHKEIFPLFGDRTLTGKTVMRLEPVPSTTTCSG
ncbi:MAG: hypothetical protein JWL73_3711 [Actinomycetia bacterium]|nr:hypothetical protein [Actinomycetes bacterium]